MPVRIWGAPMSDGIGYLAVLADLSEAKRAEREHATWPPGSSEAAESIASAHRISLLFEAAPDATFEVDEQRPHPARQRRSRATCSNAPARNCSV